MDRSEGLTEEASESLADNCTISVVVFVNFSHPTCCLAPVRHSRVPISFREKSTST